MVKEVLWAWLRLSRTAPREMEALVTSHVGAGSLDLDVNLVHRCPLDVSSKVQSMCAHRVRWRLCLFFRCLPCFQVARPLLCAQEMRAHSDASSNPDVKYRGASSHGGNRLKVRIETPSQLSYSSRSGRRQEYAATHLSLLAGT